jgi:hypothetical protein
VATERQHDPIRKIDPRLWEVEADTPGNPVRRRMVIVRLSTGDLVIHSGVDLSAEAFAEVEAWGTPRYLVVPNHFHRLDAPAYKERYPDLVVICPEPCRKKVEKRVPVDGGYDVLPDDPVLRVVTLRGSKVAEGVLIVTLTSGDRALIFNDTIFNLPDRLPGLGGFFVRLVGSTGGPKVTWLGRRLAVSDKRELADHLRELAATPRLTQIVVAHGAIIDSEAAAVLTAVANRLHATSAGD